MKLALSRLAAYGIVNQAGPRAGKKDEALEAPE
jgi:hypothetical protein